MIFDLEKDNDIKKLIEYLLKAKNKTVEINIYKNESTDKQRRSIWLYCGLVAQELNDAGLDIRLLLEEELEVSWSKEIIMNIYWKTIQKTLFDTDSIKDLKTNQVSEVYEELNRHLAKFSLHVPFPERNYGAER